MDACRLMRSCWSPMARRDDEGDHEEDEKVGDLEDEQDHQQHGQRGVEPHPPVGLHRLEGLTGGDLQPVGVELLGVELAAFAHAEPVGDGDDRQAGEGHGADHVDEVLTGVQVQDADAAGRGASPRGGAGDGAQGHGGQGGEDERVDAQTPVDRQERGADDHVAGGAVTVERHAERQYGGADDDADGIALGRADDRLAHRLEEFHLHHQAEVEDGEQQQGGGGRDRVQAVGDHVAELGALAGHDGGDDRGEHDGGERGEVLPHHEQHEAAQSGEAEDGEHRCSLGQGWGPPVGRRRGRRGFQCVSGRRTTFGARGAVVGLCAESAMVRAAPVQRSGARGAAGRHPGGVSGYAWQRSGLAVVGVERYGEAARPAPDNRFTGLPVGN